MKMEELTPHIEELKRVIGEGADEEQIIEELNTYLNVYHVSVDAAKKGIMRKYGKDTPFVSAASITKKISEMTGDEKNVDLTARVVFIEERQITAKGVPKTIFSGILGDETGTASFTVWDVSKFVLEKGVTYDFRNAYTKMWNEKLQINFGDRSLAGISEKQMEAPERLLSASSDTKIAELREGVGNVTITGKILSVETKEVIPKGENAGPKTVFTGIIADDTGKIQFTAWNDFDLKTNETVCAKNAYIRAWRGVPQLNFGDLCEISRVDFILDVQSGANERSVAEIVRAGGGLDVMVTGAIVDIKTGSGLIRRCPQCNRSVLGDECAMHGKVEAVYDLRMKIVIDDGTGPLSAVVSKESTEELIGITLDDAVAMAKATGDNDSVYRKMEEKILVMNVFAIGNVLSDEYGPMMIVREIGKAAKDIQKEAKELLDKVEGAL
ncbi:MAG: single-stranded DNA-binding protein [Methanomassiliicoccaceae archaeon]|nr:single-stranded DNA-binding protein [Methanomassiliicoccaceae archaeon]